MVKSFSRGRKKEIALDRIRFFIYEVALLFIFIFLLLLIPLLLVPAIVKKESYLYGVSFYVLRAIMIFIGIPLMLYLSNLLFESQKRKVIIDEDISPSVGHLRLFKITKKNYKYQILYGILIYFLVFLPIGFFTYLLVPKMLEYQAIALFSQSTGEYLGETYLIFLISVIVIQFSVAIAEESVSRGLLTKRGSEHFFRMSAVMISALYFGLGHFAYFFDPISRLYPFWYPFIWFLEALIIGIILSLMVLRRKWLFPTIIAHTLNNIISSHAVWSFLQGNDFTLVTFYIYYPLLVIGCCLFVWYYSQIKESLSIGFKMLKTYFKRDETSEETKGDIIFRVFIDIFVGISISIMGLMIAI